MTIFLLLVGKYEYHLQVLELLALYAACQLCNDAYNILLIRVMYAVCVAQY